LAELNDRPSLSGTVVIPALNEERAIREVVEEALANCGRVIVVDDGSSDRTSAVIADLPVERIRHARPMGKATALRDGFRRALELGADGVLTMDGDGQHAAADLPRLLAAAKQYPNSIVIGARLRSKNAQPGKNRFGNQQADFWVSRRSSWRSRCRMTASSSRVKFSLKRPITASRRSRCRSIRATRRIAARAISARCATSAASRA
jgi:glycosyltransferase involved in cell wall biosynthesis